MATDRTDGSQFLRVDAAARTWTLERPADLETLWQSMDEGDPGAEEHIPYWVELWPATLALGDWLARQDLAGLSCLDLGCGLGLSALVASSRGAKVVGMDYEREALYFAARNARLNAVPNPLWVCMDWNRPGFAPASFDRIWGGDVFYEQRFFEPLELLLLRCLAPGGRAWFGDPERTVSQGVWPRFTRRGWRVRNQGQVVVPFEQARMTVNLWELSRPH
jgi:predicted nicotinamide N-methyase